MNVKRIGKYPTEDAAFARVNHLKESGIWPGIRVYKDGSADLLYDPDPDVNHPEPRKDD